MKNQTLNQTTNRWQATSVVPTYGFGMADVCPMTVDLGSDLSTVKRHAAAIKATPATAHVREGFRPWSPPVT